MVAMPERRVSGLVATLPNPHRSALATFDVAQGGAALSKTG